MRQFQVGVVGATGMVGREMVKILAARRFPVAALRPLASARSIHETVTFGRAELPVGQANPKSFEGLDLVLMAAGSEVSDALAPLAAAAGSYVIDNSSRFRMDPEVPLVVPEVNAAALAHAKVRRLVANPNCSTIQMVVALGPLHRAFGLQRVVASTYQAVSGSGKGGVDELSAQVLALYNQQDFVPQTYPKRIAFNCLPHIGTFLPDGYTAEERKMHDESRKILALPELTVSATCVRVPVFNGHAVSVNASFARPFELDAAREVLRGAPGVVLQDDPAALGYPTPMAADGEDATFVGRLRRDVGAPNTLNFFCTADNLRKGAALNAVQIAELLVRDHLP